MAQKPKKICNHPGCNIITTERYCPKHTIDTQTRHKYYDRYVRTPEEKARYGARWQKIRAAYISMFPVCEICADSGRLKPAEEVHHMKPLSEGGTNDFDNLQSLCKSCHSRITIGNTRKYT